MAAITISRQYGSGGRKTALRLSEILGWSLFDKRLMLQVASDVGLSSMDMEDFTEDDYKIRSFWDRLFGGAGGSSMALGGEAPATITTQQMDQEGAVRLVNKAIELVYEKGNVIIVGRGGQAVLKDKRDVIHVRVQAPMDVRTSRLQTYEGVNPDDVLRIAQERDRAAEQYMKRFFNVDLEDPYLYHMIINSGKVDTDKAAQMIADSAKQYFATV